MKGKKRLGKRPVTRHSPPTTTCVVLVTKGRPAIGHTPKRYFRMDAESWLNVEYAARMEGVTVSSWIRACLLEEARRQLEL